jgi:hypothetical protein
VAAALFVVAAVVALLFRAGSTATTATADLHHPVSSLWLGPILLGGALTAPLPPLRRDALRRLAVATIRALPIPVLVLAALILLARSGLVEHPTATTNALLVAGYWAGLVIVMVRMCAYVAEVYEIATVPSVRRLRPGLLLVGTGIALAAGQTLWDAMHCGTPCTAAPSPRPLPSLHRWWC